ncbi:SDR family NAD(P)-dependent oxidoreductase [Fervidibacillus halotolerans]|uniref:Glucose 1-dehydrogenase n=1 Tax=Fervidibacillus halotolerans TaxID=2980027 RepID=A0A9E8RXX5_9BACI|nr:glucose 1-dehydrogenase [Fervidibacillus halotolerans]WAA13215.1 glucose 1-dehydrogenase [Fervidibacillus halotolerans]
MFTNRTIIVTGGANGIGKEIAIQFANHGGNVVIADRDTMNGKKLEADLANSGKKCLFVETDVKKERDIIRLVETTLQVYGTIDVLVNNAGISKFHSFFDLSVAEWDEVIQTNLRSVFLCSREAAKRMKSKGGCIINIASTRAFMSEANTEGYSASKGGILSLTHAMAASLHPYRIRVNSVSPGWIHTGNSEELSEQDHLQHWSGRVGKPEDIARACLFLADSKNDFITGQNITIDGGMTRKMIYE